MGWICQQVGQSAEDTGAIRNERVFQPMEGLHDTHGGTPCPEEATGRRLLELDAQVVELNGAATGIGMENDASRYGISQPKIVGCGHAVDQQSELIPASDGLHHGAVVGTGGPLGQAVELGPIIEAPIYTAQLTRQHHALQGFVDGVAIAKLREVGRHPDMPGSGCVDLRQDT